MIRLTGAEIRQIRLEWLSHPLPRKFENLIKASSKAQLRKVVEWVLENGYEDIDGAGESVWVLNLDKLEALLKQVDNKGK